ncbi:MAG TPA: DNA-binding response regulator [Nitrospirota bacterium]|nr:DNA-binding response regulator [Nitrospirota bacterium]
MATVKKKILIIDEAGFSRICSAILEKEGYRTNAISDLQNIDTTLNYIDFGLVIISYPFGADFLAELKKINIPIIILSDRLNRDLAMALDNFDKSFSYCMIKPLDYTKFRNLINQVMSADDDRVKQAHIGTVMQAGMVTDIQRD